MGPQRKQIGELRLEARQLVAGQLHYAGEAQRARIDRHAVAIDLEMEMRPGREAGRSDIADHLSGRDMGAGANQNPAHMGIAGHQIAGVLDHDIAAMAAMPAGEADDAVGRRHDRRAIGGAEVDALVHPRIAEQRMHPHAEFGGDPRAVDRDMHAVAPLAGAARIEPLRLAVLDPAHHFDVAPMWSPA